MARISFGVFLSDCRIGRTKCCSEKSARNSFLLSKFSDRNYCSFRCRDQFDMFELPGVSFFSAGENKKILSVGRPALGPSAGAPLHLASRARAPWRRGTLPSSLGRAPTTRERRRCGGDRSEAAMATRRCALVFHSQRFVYPNVTRKKTTCALAFRSLLFRFCAIKIAHNNLNRPNFLHCQIGLLIQLRTVINGS